MGRRRRARGVGARVAAIALAAVLACVGADAREAIARASLGANGAIEATLSQRYEGDVTDAIVQQLKDLKHNAVPLGSELPGETQAR